MYIDLEGCRTVFLTVLFSICSAGCVKGMEHQGMKDLQAFYGIFHFKRFAYLVNTFCRFLHVWAF